MERLEAAADGDGLSALRVESRAHYARVPEDGNATEWGVSGEHTVTIRYFVDSEGQAFVDKIRRAVAEEHSGSAKTAP